jgi:hypothetical protein
MKKLLVFFFASLLAGCAREPEQVVVIITATPRPITATAQPPTNTPAPTDTPRPTSTPKPSWTPIAIGEFEQALRSAGYSRYPWTTGDGVAAFDWIRENAYEQITTWENGSFELQVLHDPSANIRLDHMERKFRVMDEVFPAEFMTRLRAENEAYNRSVRADVSGSPDDKYAFGGEWQEVWAEYYTESLQIGGYDVWFSIWWWQSTCPAQYLYCYYPNFPGLEFTGDSSFKFYTIHIESSEPLLPSNSS